MFMIALCYCVIDGTLVNVHQNQAICKQKLFRPCKFYRSVEINFSASDFHIYFDTRFVYF